MLQGEGPAKHTQWHEDIGHGRIKSFSELSEVPGTSLQSVHLIL